LTDFEECYKRLNRDFTEDVKKIKELPSTLPQILETIGSDRLIGMLHAFILLKPSIQARLRERELAILQGSDQMQALADGLERVQQQVRMLVEKP